MWFRPPVVHLPSVFAALAGCGLLFAACGSEPHPASGADSPPTVDGVFEDRSDLLPFVHWNGMTGEFLFPEMTGGGAALIDFDFDGDLDVFFTQGEELGDGIEAGLFPPAYPLPLVDRLYRNDLVEQGELGFSDVTAAMGVDSRGYGMGVATGDVDNDGRVDLYVTNFGSNRLLLNRGNGRFEDGTAVAGVDDARWSVAATFLDFDRDGWLDLFVGNYVDYTVATNKRCRSASGALDYCGPHSYLPIGDRLFRNRGDGTFDDVTTTAGLDAAFGAALGVVAGDFDLDGWIDVYVANDGSENHLWMNHEGSRFENEALLAGSALNAAGDPEAGMGVSTGDFDNDGDEDLFVAHLTQETSTLYRNEGRGRFSDVTVPMGLGQVTWQATGFGTGWIDYDNDGWLDLVMVNGAVKVVEALARAGDPYPLHQPNQLFRNVDGRSFVETTTRAGDGFEISAVSRGAALGDLDNDGDTDLLIVNNAGAATLLVNLAGNANRWAGLEVLDSSGRPALGAWVEFVTSNGKLWRRVRSGGSFASANDPRVLVGLGSESEVERVRVHWPDGEVEDFGPAATGGYTRLQQGDGDAA